MEKQRESKIIAMLLLISITGAFNVLGETVTKKYQLPRKEISEYKSWTKVTPKPQRILLTIDGISD